MLPLYALSTLDREEAQAIENHLSACSECRRELDEWQATASALAYAAPANASLEPATEVRDRIIARVRAEAADAREERSNVVPISRATPRPVGSRPASASFQSIAAAVVLVGLITGLVVLWRQNRAAKAEVVQLSAQVADTRNQLDQEHKALEFFTQTGMHMTELAGTSDAPTAHAMLAVDRKTGHAMLMAHGLPQAPAGKAYQLWFIAGSHPMPGKVFQADAAGNVMMDDQLPTEALNAGTFAVTLEPQGGVAAPTGKMYLITSPHS
jgi:anti-sigma-K factor RskA